MKTIINDDDEEEMVPHGKGELEYEGNKKIGIWVDGLM